MKFKKGDRVKLIKGSEFKNQSKGRIGTITGITSHPTFCYYVRWEKDESSYDYRDRDLEYDKIINWRKRLR